MPPGRAIALLTALLALIGVLSAPASSAAMRPAAARIDAEPANPPRSPSPPERPADITVSPHALRVPGYSDDVPGDDIRAPDDYARRGVRIEYVSRSNHTESVIASPRENGAWIEPGTAKLDSRSVAGSLLFQAHLYDANADLILARARVLDPVTGQFLQRDPSGYQDSVNLYAAFKNDPVNKRDPTGKKLDVTDLSSEDTEALMKSLQRIAGLRFKVVPRGLFRKELAIEGGPLFGPGFSHKAREYLRKIIGDEHVVNLHSAKTFIGNIRADKHSNEMVQGSIPVRFATATINDEDIYIDTEDWNDIKGDSLAKEAFSVGLVFLHEARHIFHEPGESVLDPIDPGGGRGPVVEFVNKIEDDLGLPRRIMYFPEDEGDCDTLRLIFKYENYEVGDENMDPTRYQILFSDRDTLYPLLPESNKACER